MGSAAAIAILIGALGAYIAYLRMLEQGLKARALVTNQPEPVVRRVFEEKVAGYGWKVVDDDNPLIAQSPLLAGRRQQIGLRMQAAPNGLQLVIAPTRVWRKGLGQVPYKAHTLRMRMNAFESAIRGLDGVR